MSGGSYEYLCFKTADELTQQTEMLKKMSERLAGLGYAQDAAKETEELLTIINQYLVRADVRIERLNRVWKAIEWWDSCDSGEDDFKIELARYRGETDEKSSIR